MSGHSYEGTCPNCNGNTEEYADHKPYTYTSGECLECGFNFYPKVGYFTLEEVNTMRAERSEDDAPDDLMYPPLTKLPEQKKEF